MHTCTLPGGNIIAKEVMPHIAQQRMQNWRSQPNLVSTAHLGTRLRYLSWSIMRHYASTAPS